MHLNSGKYNWKNNIKEVFTSLEIFSGILATEGSPFDTCNIKEKSGLTTRDGDPDEVALPPHMRKYRCCAKWYWYIVWKVCKIKQHWQLMTVQKTLLTVIMTIPEKFHCGQKVQTKKCFKENIFEPLKN